MKCPYCGYQDSKVVDSRSFGDGIRRRRECLDCGARFTTHERFQVATFQVIKKDKRREEFSRDKLMAGIRKACAKRPVPNQDIESLVDQIELELQHLGRVEVPSSVVGEMVMKHLKALDRIAYIRFASVYRKFADVDSFRREIEDLVKSHEKDEKTAGAQLPLIPEETVANRPDRPSKSAPVTRR